VWIFLDLPIARIQTVSATFSGVAIEQVLLLGEQPAHHSSSDDRRTAIG
jgi:hypothetical protein